MSCDPDSAELITHPTEPISWHSAVPAGHPHLPKPFGGSEASAPRQPHRFSGPLSRPAVLLAAFDSLPTATLDLGLKGWAATISLSVHMLGLPVPGPLRLRRRVHETAGDLVTLTCDIWDADSSLRATGVQLCGLRG